MPFPVRDDDIAAVEAALGGAFPTSYRRKMAQDNGGSVIVGEDEFELFKILDRPDRKRMARTAATKVRENATARKWTGVSHDAGAIASNGAGDYLILRCRDGALGPDLHAWDPEAGDTTRVASDFAELLQDT